MQSMKPIRVLASAFLAGGVATACAGLGGMGMSQTNAMNEMACPELGGGAANASFAADAKANATIRAFVTASGDLATVAARAEEEVGRACQAMARDLGVQAAPRQGE